MLAGNSAAAANRLKIGNPICSINVLFCFLQIKSHHINATR